MDVNRLKHIVEVDRLGSLSKAAEKLNLAQSTLTKSVAKLESELGYSLFLRRSHGMETTEQGKVFVQRVARIVSDIDLLDEELKTGRKVREQVLRIGVSPPLIEGLMNRAISQYVSDAPEVCIHMRTLSVEQAPQALQRGEIDFCIGPSDNLKARAGLEAIPLGALHGRLFVNKEHPLVSKPHITMQDIEAYRFIGPDFFGVFSIRLAALSNPHSSDPYSNLHIVGNFQHAAAIVEQSQCVGVVSVDYAKSRSFLEKFAVLNIDVFDPFHLCFAHREQDHPNHSARLFLRALRMYPIVSDAK